MIMPMPGVIRNPRYHADDIAELFGNGGTVKLLYETADANANALIFVAPEGGATDVPVFIFGDASIDNVDLGFFNGVTEPTIAVINDANDAYSSLDAGDDAVAGAKGLYFKAAADEDIELINLSVTGTPRIYWDESEDQIRSTKGWVFDAACDVQGTWVATAAWTLPAFTQGGTITVTGQVFDAGTGNAEIDNTGQNKGLLIKSTQDDVTGVRLELQHVSTTPAASDVVGIVIATGNDSASNLTTWGYLRFIATVVTDGATEESSFDLWLRDAGAGNQVVKVTGAGVLSVDVAGVGTAAQVDLFDDYDDALVLRQGIQQNNRELLADMGVLTRKDTGSGYMMNLQPMVRLLAGGIYQTRRMLEDTRDKLLDRLDSVEKRLLLIGGENGKAIT